MFSLFKGNQITLVKGPLYLTLVSQSRLLLRGEQLEGLGHVRADSDSGPMNQIHELIERRLTSDYHIRSVLKIAL